MQSVRLRLQIFWTGFLVDRSFFLIIMFDVSEVASDLSEAAFYLCRALSEVLYELSANHTDALNEVYSNLVQSVM